MNKKEKTLIIGAGPAGLSCGYKLSELNKEVEIFEASPHIGGMCRSFDLWGQRVDLGPHRFFSKQEKVNSFFKQILKDDYTLVNRKTRIYYKSKYFEYPLRLLNVFNNLSLFTIIQVLWYYSIQQINPIKNPKNFEEWITDRFGKKLFEIFFKHYTEKLWGIKCFQIDADWAAQRIKSLTLFQAIKSALSFSKENKHTTLLDKFMYPKNGTGTLYEKTAEHISLKNKIHLNTPIKKVLLDHTNKKVIGIELVNGEVKDASTVISTMPLTLLVKGLPNVPEKVLNATKELYFRNTILVYLEIDQHNLFEDNWLYIHSPDVKHGRITNFRNWCPSLNKDKKTSILCLEFWCFESDQLWNDSDDFITQIAKKEIFNIDLIPSESKILNAKVIKIPKCYPVYEKGYQEKMNVIISYLKTIKGLIPIGRYGAFKYNNQDHSILMGLLATEKITTNQEIDLWKINTDTEYQENAKDILIQ